MDTCYQKSLRPKELRNRRRNYSLPKSLKGRKQESESSFLVTEEEEEEDFA